MPAAALNPATMNGAALLVNGELHSMLCAVCWAAAVILFRRGGERVPPVVMNLFKNTIGLLLISLTMLALGLPFVPADRSGSDWWVMLVSGVVGIGLADSLFFASLNRLGAGRAAIVDCMYSPSVILLAWLYLGESLTWLTGLATAMVLLAILVGTYRAAAVDHVEPREIRDGVLLGATSMLLMAFGIVLCKPVLEQSDAWWATWVRLLGGLALLVLQATLPRHRAATLACFRPSRDWLITVPGSVMGAYVALMFWISGMKHSEATVASILNQTSSLFTLVFATWFLREPLTPRKLTAIAIGMTGAALVAGPEVTIWLRQWLADVRP